MNEVKKLAAVRMILARADLTLRRRAGVETEKLRHQVSELQTAAMFLDEHPKALCDERAGLLTKLVSDTAALHVSVRDWAEKERVYYASPDTAPTIPSLSSDEVKAVLASMPPDSSEPPTAVMALALENQLVGDDVEEPSPPSAPTERRLETLRPTGLVYVDVDDDEVP